MRGRSSTSERPLGIWSWEWLADRTAACFVSDLSTGRLQGCTGSTARQTPPSYGQSSELHQANGNSTGIAYDRRRGRVCYFWYHTESGSIGRCLCLLSARLFGLIILLTVALGRGWGLQTHAAPQKPAAPWCWSHPWWKERKMSKIRFSMLSPSHSYFFQKAQDCPGDTKTPQRRFKITEHNVNPEDRVGRPYFLHESISQPEFLFSQHSCHVCSLIHTGRRVWSLEAI